MSTVQEIEHAVEQLPPDEFSKLAEWIDRKRQLRNTRNHNAFLNGYNSGDEGLYDDAVSR